PGNASRCFLRDDFQTFDYTRNHHMLQTCIQTLGIFPNDHQIEFRITTGHIWQSADRTHVGIKIERLAQTNIYRGEAFADGRGDWALERDLVARDRIDQLFGQSLAKFLESLRARVMSLPFNFYTRSFEDPHNGCGYFGSNAIAGNQCDTMFHKVFVSS